MRHTRTIIICILLVSIAAAGDIIAGGNAPAEVFWLLRIPRTLTAVLSGALLALAGAQMQAVFRNPLADPHIMGVSSGAGLGAAIATLAGARIFHSITSPAGRAGAGDMAGNIIAGTGGVGDMTGNIIAGTAGAGDMTGNIIAETGGVGDMTGNIIAGTAAIRPDIDGILQGISLAGAASLGALLVSLLVIYISRKVKGTDTLLIFGVMTGFAVNAIISILQSGADPESLRIFYSWSAGSFTNCNYTGIAVITAAGIIGSCLAFNRTKGLDILLFGDEYSSLSGAMPEKIRWVSLTGCCIMTGAVTAFCGPIGFVGIIAPHIARRITGTAVHRIVLPVSMATGGACAAAADILSRATPVPVPAGSTMALIGIPVILYIMLRNSSAFQVCTKPADLEREQPAQAAEGTPACQVCAKQTDLEREQPAQATEGTPACQVCAKQTDREREQPAQATEGTPACQVCAKQTDLEREQPAQAAEGTPACQVCAKQTDREREQPAQAAEGTPACQVCAKTTDREREQPAAPSGQSRDTELRLLGIHGLDIGYGDRTLCTGIEMDIYSGDCILLCGANGSGKTTLLRAIAGSPASGTSPALGNKSRSSRKRVGKSFPKVIMIPSGIPKVKGFTLEEFIRTGCYRISDWRGTMDDGSKARLAESMKRLKIYSLKDRDISTLSDGEFQKGCIAAALSQDAEMILLDEPTAFLDTENRIEVMTLLEEIAAAGEKAIMFSSHDIGLALRHCNRVAAIGADGRFRISSSVDNNLTGLKRSDSSWPGTENSRTGGVKQNTGIGARKQDNGTAGVEQDTGTGAKEKDNGTGGVEQDTVTGAREKDNGTGGVEQDTVTGAQEKNNETARVEHGTGTGAQEWEHRVSQSGLREKSIGENRMEEKLQVASSIFRNKNITFES